uniref:MBD domain-containing protein n=3 Tax=Aegilops tauschii TaxID=37682 RepID=A0A452XC52_AEGTS
LLSKGQLPDGWRKEVRPRKDGTKSDPYYTDPVSGYEFRSLKDVQRYIESGDISKCNVRPKKRTAQDACITQNQDYTGTSSEYARPGTADKAIQCELLTEEGIRLPWEEMLKTYTQNTMLPVSEVMKLMQKYADKVDPSEHKSVQPVSRQRASRGKRSVQRKEPNAEVKTKKRKTMSKEKVATPLTPRVSPRLVARKVNPEVNTEPQDEPTIVNHANQVKPIQEKTVDVRKVNPEGNTEPEDGPTRVNLVNQVQLVQQKTADVSQADTVIQMQTKHGNTASQLQSRQTDAAVPVQINEGTVNRSQLCQPDPVTQIQADTVVPVQTNHVGAVSQLWLSQAATANRIQTNQESTASRLQSNQAENANHIHGMQKYTTNYSQLRKADTTHQKQTNQKNTASQLRSSQEKSPFQKQTGQKYVANYSQLPQSHGSTVNHRQTNQQHTANQNQLQSSQADTANVLRATKEFFVNHSLLRQAGAVNHMQGNQENTAIRLQLGQADAVKQMQTIQGNSTDRSQLVQGLPVNQTQTIQEYFTKHSQPSPVNTVNQMQISQENTANQLRFSQANSVSKAQTMQENTTSRSQLIQGLTVNQIQAIRENNTRYLQPRYTENPIQQSGFSPAPEWGHGAPATGFWNNNAEHQKSSVPMQIDAAPIATSSANVEPQYAPTPEPVLPTQTAEPGGADPSGFALPSFGNSWSDPCIEFAFKTLTGDIPVLDPTVADYFPLQQDLNKVAPPDYSAPSVDDTRNHTQHVNQSSHHSAPRPSNGFYNGGWFPPQ